jgi:uncharacterized membrane protein (DUF441 family)
MNLETKRTILGIVISTIAILSTLAVTALAVYSVIKFIKWSWGE